MTEHVTGRRTEQSELVIDLARCAGHARCMQSAPEVFEYDDDANQALLLAGADPEAHRRAVDTAILGCPEGALSWRTRRDDDAGEHGRGHRAQPTAEPRA